MGGAPGQEMITLITQEMHSCNLLISTYRLVCAAAIVRRVAPIRDANQDSHPAGIRRVSLSEASSGIPWIETFNESVDRYVYAFHGRNGLPDDVVCSVEPDVRGFLRVSGARRAGTLATRHSTEQKFGECRVRFEEFCLTTWHRAIRRNTRTGESRSGPMT